MFDLEGFQDTCMSHALGMNYPGNVAIMLFSVDGYNEHNCRDRGCTRSRDGSFSYDAITSIRFNNRHSILAHAIRIIDAPFIEVRQAHEVDDSFMSEAKYRSI